MRVPFSILVALFLLPILAQPAHPDQIIQEGSLSGGTGPMTQDLVLSQFDDMAGSLVLNFVRLEALTAVGGGYQTDGSGTPVDILARLDCDYSLGADLLIETQALIQMTVPNPAGAPPIAVSLFDSDTGEAMIDEPLELAPWIGGGDVVLSVFTDFLVSENPPGVINFGAGGTIQYTLIYDFDIDTEPDFVRGDADNSGDFSALIDGVFILSYGFVSGAPAPACLAAADCDGDEVVTPLVDALFALSFGFVPGSPPIPAPHPACGPGAGSTQALGCEAGACP